MALVRGWWLALVAAPVALLTSGTALADSPGTGTELPRGIHLGRSGRYYQDACDHSLGFHCLAMRVLPETYRPLAGGAGNAGSAACGCSNTNPCGGGGNVPPPGSLAPDNIQAAYQVPASASAGGKIVAVIDMPDPHALADVNVYRSAFGIPPLPQCTGNGLPDPSGGTPCFAAVDEAGKITTSAGDCKGADSETALDAEMVSAACPDCSIVLVQMTDASMDTGPTDLDFVASAKSAIKLGAVAVSISYGGQELSDPTGQDYTTPGHLVVAASGDAGYLNAGLGTPSYPSSAPDVLGIGGTTLQLQGQSYSEVTWDDIANGAAAGSGCSTEFSMPPYQSRFLAAHAGAFGSCAKRASSDMSAAADFSDGRSSLYIAEYDSVSGWLPVVGTSAAAPMVAGLFTRLGLTDAISGDLGWVYDHISDFNDITSGNNDLATSCSDVMCTAGKGWDGPTGVGTPDAPKLTQAATQDGDAGAGAQPGNKGGCGCTTAAARGNGPLLLALGGIFAAFALRRRLS